jgi:AcrR family transcriptional regulator
VTAQETAALSRTALRWEAHKEETRRRLLDSARTLFAERGYQATSAADIAAAAGVTERTLFRYFPSKSALVLNEVIDLLPAMFETIRDRPAAEPPYEAVCNAIMEFAKGEDLLLIRVFDAPGAIDLPLDDRQKSLIEFEDTLAAILHDRYQLPADDKLTATVWACASLGALRTALSVMYRTRTAEGLPKGALHEALFQCFSALAGSPGTAVLFLAAGSLKVHFFIRLRRAQYRPHKWQLKKFHSSATQFSSCPAPPRAGLPAHLDSVHIA